ncbi:hypothetical protein C8R44DRAFT_416657 [Mycena epipterygia]|nr:hypothetical protein C8R44DRAFT_416657 [Mycena epipterygia]
MQHVPYRSSRRKMQDVRPCRKRRNGYTQGHAQRTAAAYLESLSSPSDAALSDASAPSPSDPASIRICNSCHTAPADVKFKTCGPCRKRSREHTQRRKQATASSPSDPAPSDASSPTDPAAYADTQLCAECKNLKALADLWFILCVPCRKMRREEAADFERATKKTKFAQLWTDEPADSDIGELITEQERLADPHLYFVAATALKQLCRLPLLLLKTHRSTAECLSHLSPIPSLVRLPGQAPTSCWTDGSTFGRTP